MNRLSSALLSVLLVLTSSLAGEEISAPKLQVVTEEGYPINYLDTNTGEVVGFATEFLKLLLQEADLEYELKLIPWSRAYRKAISEPNVIIYSMGRLPERESQFEWIGPVMDITYNLYGLTRKADQYPRDIEKLKTYRVAVTKNDLNHSYLKNNGFTNLIFVHDYPHMNNLLERERVDFIASSLTGTYFFTQRYNKGFSYLTPIHGFSDLDVSLYYAVSKNTDSGVVKRLKEAYKVLVDKGVFDKVMRPLLEQQAAAIN